jgi:cobalt/nickel transport system permease protein
LLRGGTAAPQEFLTLRHVVVDDWSTQDGPLHRREARAKLLALITVLVSVALTISPASFVVLALLLAAGVSASRAPIRPFARRLAALLIFPLTFAALVAFTGDASRASLLFFRSTLSVTAILVTVATTPMSRLIQAMRAFGVPPMLAEIVQFVYRYLFVLAEEAWHIRTAAAVRGGQRSVAAAASSLGVLFGRAYWRAEGIHRAILSRSYSGLMYAPVRRSFDAADTLFVAAVAAVAIACPAAERLF